MRFAFTIFALLLAARLLGLSPATAAVAPLKPLPDLVAEVVGFLVSDVGVGGIRTMDDDPLGDPVPPYFYHYAIWHDDTLPSNTNGYPGFASISYPGYTASIGIDAFLAWWLYTGDPVGLARAREFADWLVARRTPANDVYGNWVYSTQTDGVMGGGFDGDAIMSDKPAMFALRCLRLFDITGDPSYYDCALETAQTYVVTQLSGAVEDDGRWPFRVRPLDGAVRQDYTSHLMPAIRLLEAMELRLSGQGFAAAAARAWNWIDQNVLEPTSPSYQRWEAFYEDIGPAEMIGLRDHYGAENYLEGRLDRAGPGDLDQAIAIFDWSSARYFTPGIGTSQDGFGAYTPAILEWDAWPNSTYSATAQWAWVQLRLDAAAAGMPQHDPQWRAQALQALHTLTYGQGPFAPPAGDGRMLTTVRELTQPGFLNQTWYEQSFNTVKFGLLSLGFAPELAPNDEDHLLAFEGGEAQLVAYAADRILTRWSAPGRLLFKLIDEPQAVWLGNAWHLAAVDLGGEGPAWSWDPARQLCEVVHPGGDVEIALAAGAPVSVGTISAARAHLGGAAPNPFNPRTQLGLHLEAAAQVRARVVDSRGRRVAELRDEWLAAGEHRLEWDGRDDAGRAVVSGVYRLVLDVEGRREQRSLVLVR